MTDHAEGFRAKYQGMTSEALLGLSQSGAAGYRPEAWEALQEEIAHRGLSDAIGQVTPSDGSSESSPRRLAPWVAHCLIGLGFFLAALQFVSAILAITDRKPVGLTTYPNPLEALGLAITYNMLGLPSLVLGFAFRDTNPHAADLLIKAATVAVCTTVTSMIWF